MGNQMWHLHRNCRSSGKSGEVMRQLWRFASAWIGGRPGSAAGPDRRLLGELDRGADFADADEDFRAQVGGGRVAAAVLGHEPLDRLLEAVLAQAGAAFVQVLADLRAVHFG